MGRPLVSVVVPVYGIAPYVGLCVESALKQTLTDIEIILVDDGSPDEAPGICDLYARHDRRVRVIHKQNGGLVSARKAGSRAANGEYLAHVDGDDWVEPQYLESLYVAAAESGADVVIGGYQRDIFEKSEPFPPLARPGLYEGSGLGELKLSAMSRGKFHGFGVSTYAWGKLLRTTLARQCQEAIDDKITIGEDAALIYPTIMCSNLIAVVDTRLYHYRQHNGSMLKKVAPFAAEVGGLRLLREHMGRALACYGDNILRQADDLVLSLCVARSGGFYACGDVFGPGRVEGRVAVCCAGSFGKRVVACIADDPNCEVVAWVDDDYWEYRRLGMDITPVEHLAHVVFDRVVVAATDAVVAEEVCTRLIGMGIDGRMILSIDCERVDRRALLDVYLGGDDEC